MEAEDIAAAAVVVARTHRAMTYVPRRLRLVFRATLSMPERPRGFLTRVTRAEQAFLVMDQATRDAYHARATGGGDPRLGHRNRQD